MKLYSNKNIGSKKGKPAAKAFTLVELTVVISVGMMVAMMALGLLQQQLISYRIVQSQNFLVAEAPQINNTLNRIINRASFIQVYPDLASAKAGGNNATLTNGKVLVLRFIDAGGNQNTSTSHNQRIGIIAFDASTNSINYYNITDTDLANFDPIDVPGSGGNPAISATPPSWTISSYVNNVDFFIQQGVLRMQIDGFNGDQITYSVTTQK